MKTISKALALSLIIVAFLTGTGIGYLLTPNYQKLVAQGGGHGAYSDPSFLKGLQSHHMQALDIAQQGLKSTREEVKALSRKILESMPGNIAQLKTWRVQWFQDETLPKPEAINLGSFDDNFDLRWLNALDLHHREAITMAQGALKSSLRGEILTLGSEVIRLDTADLAQFAAWRSQWYNK